MANGDVKHWVGFDLGGTKMLATIYDDGFRPVASRRKRAKGNEGVAAGLERIVSLIRRTLEDAGLTAGCLGGIGVGSPGPVDLEAGLVLHAANLNWSNVPLRAELEREFGCPVSVVNDVDAGVYAESRFGAGQGARTVLGVFPGTGIGGGCVYDGQIVRGRRASCLEIGHIQVRPNGPRCGCGLTGCLETEASRLAIAAAAAQAAYRGEAPHLLKLAGTDLSEIRSGTLAQAIAEGDEVIERIVRRAAGYLGQAIATAVTLLAPDCVVLGGGLVGAMPKLIVGEAEKSARKHVLPSFVETFSVVAAELGDNATSLGSAAWARHIVQG